ncbi:ankyrin repeat protein (B-cell lymphoma 3-encoded protein) [Seiridium cupressi]
MSRVAQLLPISLCMEEMDLNLFRHVILGRPLLKLKEVLQSADKTILQELDHGDTMSKTPLHWAAMLNDAQSVRDSAEAGAKVDVIDDVGLTPLAHAVETRPSGKYVDVLASISAHLAAFDHNSHLNILHRACWRGVVETVKKLRRAGVNLDIPAMITLITPLMVSMAGGQAETVEYLIISGADMNAVDQMGRSALSYEVDKDSQTLLHDAAVLDDSKVLQVLAEAYLTGLDVTLRNKTENTALDIQRKYGSTDSAIRAAFQSLLDGIQDTTEVKMDNIDEDVFCDALK